VFAHKLIGRPEFRPKPQARRPGGRAAVAALGTLAGLALVGCGREDVRVYQAPKEQAAPPTAADPHAGLDMSAGLAAAARRPTASAPLTWQAPGDWKEQPSGQMRVGFFTVAGDSNQQAEVTIIPLSGRAGGDLDNVNRWLDQLGAPAITTEQLGSLAENVIIAEAQGQLFDLRGPESAAARKRMLVAVLRRDGTSWFFKMMGDDALVGAQKRAFAGFLGTVRFQASSGAASEPAAAAAATVPAATPPSPATAGLPSPPTPPMPAIAGPPPTAKPTFTVPANWTEQTPGSMQLAKYVPAGASGKAEVTVAVLPGDGGGTGANVNRWRRQLGLEPWGEAALKTGVQPMKVDGAEAYLVDLGNPATQKRMIAVGVLHGGQSWFYKLTGETAAVEAERLSFVRFVEGARYAQ